jgi:hypothetical protein
MSSVCTFWEKSTIALLDVFAQKPAIAKLIVAFDQFNAVTTGEA